VLAGLAIFVWGAEAQNINLEPILINKYISLYNTRNADLLTDEDISALTYDSPQEALDYFSSVDLRKRSSFGIQQDLSIRGSIFEDNEVYLEGIRINDPQTGHFSLELPVTEYDISSIALDSNSQRVSFKIKLPKEEGVSFKHYWGQYALYGNSVSFNFKTAKATNRISYEHRISSGARQDTDFNIHNLLLDSFWNGENNNINIIFGMTQRDFGAANSYSSLYPNEEEHTRQKLLIMKSNTRCDKFSLINKVFARVHDDKFILDRNIPSLYTNHTTSWVYGFDSRLEFNGFYCGLLFNGERMESDSMGKHARCREELYLNFSPRINQLSFDISFNETHYEEFGWLEKVLFGGYYKLNDKLSADLILSYLWRIPSFTELYYWSPANHGNNNLHIQKTLNYETGFGYALNHDVSLRLAVFMRRQSRTIDWVKSNELSAWEARNIGRIRTQGLNCDLKIGLGQTPFEYLSLHYTYLSLKRVDSHLFSKYAFDYLKHKITANILMKIHKFRINYTLNFNSPSERGKYCVFSVKIIRRINNNTDFFIEGNNIFNTSYYELGDVKGDPRWYKLGLSFNF